MSIVEVSNLRKEYPSFLLKDISFAIRQGRITGFIGGHWNPAAGARRQKHLGHGHRQ